MIIRRAMSVATSPSFPITQSITSKLKEAFDPVYLDVINESHMHNVPKNSETHFKVVVVSEEFVKTKSLIARHRLVNATLQDELTGSVHALSIVAKTPSQWNDMQAKGDKIMSSPSCRGGDGSLPSR
uniref:BolA-like protein n=1 Tax=Leptocylindrus danicus TaxID=163516 RepID=A0A7S2P2A9_9STRA|eukprot:CAMPEP_0116029608 /NCGR_PEP_ID=MMETSP0321-20121206/16242_1 /TAXON_ID=163516 /ORGANISM="Leptocylindrus danicus var. danicus, Strain B650" /LENGTH=126 /DNA_ID=CAMNT_0003504019 /DNA_START=13 /DNA_END=393 /DNA_ORIENTATION=+